MKTCPLDCKVAHFRLCGFGQVVCTLVKFSCADAQATLLILGDCAVFSCSGKHRDMAYFLMGSGMGFVNTRYNVLPVYLRHLL